MKRTSLRFVLISAVALLPSLNAMALDYNWNVLGGGSQTWNTPANWNPNGIPNTDVLIANLSVPLTGNLNVNIGGAPLTIGGLNIGGTGAAVTTEISANAGGKLILSDNDDTDFDNDLRITGDDFLAWQRGLSSGTTNAQGDADLDGDVDAADLTAWKQVAIATITAAVVPNPQTFPSRLIINSNGAAGTVNTITAPVQSGLLLNATPTYRDETVEIRGTQSLNFAGGYFLSGPGNVLNSFLPADATLTINGIALSENEGPAGNQTLQINNNSTAIGRVEIPGVISGGGSFTFGNTSANVPIPTILLSGNNTYTGRFTFNRANVILANDNALGSAAGGADIRPGNPSNSTGFNLISDSDTRSINAEMRMAQFVNFTGEHSLTWTGVLMQSNSRGFINTLAAGKQLTITGNIYGGVVADTTTTRVVTIDGSGKTVITGEVSNLRYNDNNSTVGSVSGNSVEPVVSGVVNALVKAGSGAVYLNGLNSYNGPTTVSGGNLHFGVFNDTTATSMIVANFGAIGAEAYESGATMLDSFYFLSRFSLESTGGLMINASDAAATFDFTAGSLPSKMSLAAPESGLTFTGSIVPADSVYRLGGGAGTLTLPNAQLTGANSLVATNGGVVALNGANTYSGTTSAVAKYTTSLTNQAAVTGAASSSANTPALNRVYGGTVIAASNLQNGGVASSIGSSSSVAANIVIQGSTLRYTGTGSSTDRLLTVGTGGATIESSGSGAVNFTNTGSLAMDEAEVRTGTWTSGSPNVTGITNVDDLVVGMPVSGAGIAANTTISAINYPNPTVSTSPTVAPLTVVLSANTTANGAAANLTFGSVARTLNLGGTNTGNNTLRPNIVNGGAATNVVKADAGKWILTGSNTYTGTTTVNGGALLVNGTHTGGGAYTVAAGATLGGTGSIAANITDNGVLSPGTSAGALTVTGTVTFNAGSTALFEIGGTAAGQFDELNLSGALTAGGTFQVNLINAFTPSIGDSFDVLDFASATGSFALSLPSLGAGKIWSTTNLLTTGTISVVAGVVGVPEPSSIALAGGALAALAAVRSRRRSSIVS